MIIGYITGQSLKIQAPVVVSDSINYLTAQFFFQTEDWQNLTKWAHFKQGDKVYDFVLKNDRIEKDAHLNLSDGEWEIYLHGNEFAYGEVVERITTEIITLTVKKSGVLEGELFAEQPATAVESLNAKLDDVLKTITSLFGELKNKVDFAIDSDDPDLDQMSEIVNKIKSHVEVLNYILNNKVGFEDIVNDLSTALSNRPLSAAQGVVLKQLIENISVPTKVSELVNDLKYQTETDMALVVYSVAKDEAKKVENKIPTKVSELENDTEFQTEENVINIVSEKIQEAEIGGTNIPTKVSFFENDVGYQTESQVEAVASAKASAVEAKIPKVPVNVSAFSNDAKYQTLTDINALRNEINKKLDEKQNDLEFDNRPKATSSNPVTSDGIHYALLAKQDKLTFDSTPTANSSKPVTSDGIKKAIDTAVKADVINLSLSEIIHPDNVVLALPQGVTYDSIVAAHNAGKTVVCTYTPSAEVATILKLYQAQIVASLAVVQSNYVMFSALNGDTLCRISVQNDNSVVIRTTPMTLEITKDSSHYEFPSAAAVYDAILKTRPSGGDGSSNVFVFDLIFEDYWHFAEGVTYDAIVAAVNSGMVVIGNLIDEAQYSDAFTWGIKTIQFSRFADEEGTAAIFTGIGIAWMDELPLYIAGFVVGEFGMEEVDGERVIRESDLYDYQETSALTTSLSDKSTDQQYPSAKAVYDFVNSNSGTGSDSSKPLYFDVDLAGNPLALEYEDEMTVEDAISAIADNKTVYCRIVAPYDEDENGKLIKMVFVQMPFVAISDYVSGLTIDRCYFGTSFYCPYYFRIGNVVIEHEMLNCTAVLSHNGECEVYVNGTGLWE